MHFHVFFRHFKKENNYRDFRFDSLKGVPFQKGVLFLKNKLSANSANFAFKS